VAATVNAAVSLGAQWSVLVAHPDTPADFVDGIAVEAHFAGPGVLVCDYALHADLQRVVLPAAGAGERRDGLWRHTCFEAFLAVPGLPGYFEFNFSPGGDWAAYRFEGYREGMAPLQLSVPPALHVRGSTARLEMSARVELADIAELVRASHLRLGLAAVLEHAAGGVSYWALHHATGKPDFHHPEGFALDLSPP
jgi:hypothetical protein